MRNEEALLISKIIMYAQTSIIYKEAGIKYYDMIDAIDPQPINNPTPDIWYRFLTKVPKDPELYIVASIAIGDNIEDPGFSDVKKIIESW